jgi:hypothetical protein
MREAKANHGSYLIEQDGPQLPATSVQYESQTELDAPHNRHDPEIVVQTHREGVLPLRLPIEVMGFSLIWTLMGQWVLNIGTGFLLTHRFQAQNPDQYCSPAS